MAPKNWLILFLLFALATSGCLVGDLMIQPAIEKRVQASSEKTEKEISQRMGLDKPVPPDAWGKGASLVIISSGPWKTLAVMVQQRDIAGGVLRGVLFEGLALMSRDDLYRDVTAEFQAGTERVLSPETIGAVRDRFNDQLLQHLKAKLGCPVRVANFDIGGDMTKQSQGIYQNPPPGERQVFLMPHIMFSGKTPEMKVELRWTLTMDPVAWMKSMPDFRTSPPPPGFRPSFDAAGKVTYKSAKYSPNQWLENSGVLLTQELDKAADKLALDLAQALSGRPN